MNQERILELAKQADPDHWHSRWCSGINPRVMDPEIKKLAELIVQECMRMCEVAQVGYFTHGHTLQGEGCQGAKQYIADWFEVEE